MTPSSITVSVTPVSMEAPARAVWKAITVTVRLVSHHSSCKSQVFQACSQAVFIRLGHDSSNTGKYQDPLGVKYPELMCHVIF